MALYDVRTRISLTEQSRAYRHRIFPLPLEVWMMRLLGVSSLLLWGIQIHAHSMYQSAVLLDFIGHTVKAELQLPLDRLSISFRQTVDNAHLTRERPALLAYVQAHVH